MNKGFLILLASLGIKIDPEEIDAAWNRSKDALPQLAREFTELKDTMSRVEAKLDTVLGLQLNSALNTALKPIFNKNEGENVS